jgi:maltooligosyltrehalose trehalohydrolase
VGSYELETKVRPTQTGAGLQATVAGRLGAEPLRERGVHFRVWAPRRRRVDVVVEGIQARAIPLDPEGDGHFSGVSGLLSEGALYRYRLDAAEAYPDPASRFQPDGPHGPSAVVDPTRYEWHDQAWTGLELPGQVLYEMHVGTFTAAGTWAAAQEHLPHLVDLGVTAVEIMPVADFSGRFGWGYDGVCLFAPTRLYGSPDDFRHFVDAAHQLGLGVLLDVVFNHFGPDGNYVTQYSDTYFTRAHQTEWGEPINFYGDGSRGVREFFLANVRHWIEEYHLDGLRLDATQCIFDRSEPHILAEISREVRAAAGGRRTLIVAENEPQDVRLLRSPHDGGFGIDAVWNDDFHHTARVAATGKREAYYTDYHGSPQEFVSAAKHGYLYQGQRYQWQRKRRGTLTRGVRPAAFVAYLDNHDQVGNSTRGERLHALTSPGRFRALTAMTLLGPWTPLLFQGQEFAASSPFLFFANHDGELGDAVRKGRREYLAQFPSLASKEWDDQVPDPCAQATFERCCLDHGERLINEATFAMHRDLLTLRREDPVLKRQGEDGIDGAVLAPHAFVLRFFDPAGRDRILLVNLGVQVLLDPLPEPLMAPPAEHGWVVLWSSDDVRYGGNGTPPLERGEVSRLPGEASLLLRPDPSLSGDSK